MKERYNLLGENIIISSNVKFGQNLTIGHCSYVGYGKDENLNITIGDNVNIGAFCMLENGIIIGNNVDIDHQCLIYSGSSIGDNTKILYASKIFSDSKIGNKCIIGADVPERTIIEDNVTMLGEIAHSHRDATTDWDTTNEPSPIIKKGSIVGCRALIIGGVVIGEGAYIGAGEVVRCDIPPNSVLYKGEISPIDNWRGLIKTRG